MLPEIPPLPLQDLQLTIAILVISVAYTIRGITGFGSGLIAIPILALMLPLQIVVPMIGLLDYLASLSHGMKHRRQIAMKEILPLIPFTLIGVLAGLYLLKEVDSQLLSRVLGGFVLIYAFYSLFAKEFKGECRRVWSAPAGIMGGAVGTLFGTGGPFYIIYLQMRRLDKTGFRATIATIFLLDGTSRIIGYSLSGLYSLETLWLMLISIPLMGISLYIGGHIHTEISAQGFRRAIGYTLIISGCSLLLK